jgi:hypothetical protein
VYCNKVRDSAITSIELSVLVAVGLFGCGRVVTPVIQDASSDAMPSPPDAVPCLPVQRDYAEQGTLGGDVDYTPNVGGTKFNRVRQNSPLVPVTAGTFVDYFQLEVWAGYAPFGTSQMPTPIVAGTYEITPMQAQFATCSVCVRMGAAWDGAVYRANFFATSGRVVITTAGNAVGESWATEAFDIKMKEVTIANGVSTFVNPGCEVTVKHALFSGVMVPPP